ncbi:hypothetical protein SAMN05216199_3649 [Pedococcus cremeus]|uniref:Glycosyltransferase RgtA/B/C/D-like domain-containing protein n=1 Tax=Pedococcus cremeus TaxID=587636 RepID=A0A1H9XC65_9MICO|nr:hypothetical protein [Pedococcus cremeus]SES43714.1 hypothetical protein SAMN05216199_3649 [Pedococcus cremeus]
MKRLLKEYGPALAIYLVTRLLAVLFVVATSPGRVVHMEALPGYHSVGPAILPADYGTVMTSWDSQWYWDIAQNGYPDSARGADGQPQQTSLAFFPLYPMLVRLLMAITKLDFPIVAPTLSLLIGAAAVLVVYRLTAEATGRGQALSAVALLCCFPAAPIFQAAYTESLALLLVGSALLLVLRQRYWWAIIPVLLLGLTRNISLVLAPVIALHWWVRVARPLRRRDGRIPWPPVSLLALFTASVAATGMWLLLAGAITGEPDAYLTTMKAWPGFTSSPFDPPWLAAAHRTGAAGWVVLAVLVLSYAGLLLRLAQRSPGPELWGWAATYPAYILMTTGATWSIVRYLLLSFPIALALVPGPQKGNSKMMRASLVAGLCLLGIAAQWVWVSKLLVYAGPQGGWGFP